MNYEKSKSPRLPFEVSNICFGAAPLSSMPETYGYSVSEEQARDTIDTVFEMEHSFLDTSRNYGFGRSEERIGQVVRQRGGLPKGAVISTKVDRDYKTHKFDAARVRQSAEESLETLGIEQFQVLHLHDPEYASDLEDVTRKGGALDTLFALKEEGITRSVGLAMGRSDILMDLLKRWEFDALISHNRFTLLNRSAGAVFDEAHSRGIAIFNAAPFAGGVLAQGSAKVKKITYQDVDEDQLAPVVAIEEICARHGIPVGAAALQFSMRDPRVTSTIVGVSKPERVASTLALAGVEISEEVWSELMALSFSSDDPEANRVHVLG